MTLLAALQAAAPLRSSEVEAGGLKLRIREMSIADRDAFVAAQKAGLGVGPLLLSLCVIGDDGAPSMKGQEAEIAATVAPSVIDDVAVAILALSGLASKNG